MFGKPVTVRIEAKLLWQFAYDPDGQMWLGVCQALNLNAWGKQFHDVQRSAAEAVSLLFLDLFEDGELETFLERRGWTPMSPMPERGTKKVWFDVPFDAETTTTARDLVPA